jgi:hypothetical protein
MGNLSTYNYDEPAAPENQLLPCGIYPVKIVKSTIEPNSKGTGDRLNLTFEITSGEHEGRWVYHSLNLTHSNPKAQHFGRLDLKAICDAVNIPRPKDTSELHFIPLLIDVQIEPAQNGYPEKNKIVAWMPTTDVPEVSDASEPMPWEV